MTIFDKIEVKIVQVFTLSIYILLSRKWFAWLLKLPVFVLLGMCMGYYPPVRMAICLGNNTTCHRSGCILRKGNLVARESMY